MELIPEFNFICNVIDKDTKGSIPNTKVILNDNINSNEDIVFTDNEGIISIKLNNYNFNDHLDYSLTLEKDGYLNKLVNFDTILYKVGN